MTVANRTHKELYEAAASFVSVGLSGKSNFDFRVRRNEYVYVAEKDEDELEICYTLSDWLGAVAILADEVTSIDEIQDVAMLIEDQVFAALKDGENA